MGVNRMLRGCWFAKMQVPGLVVERLEWFHSETALQRAPEEAQPVAEAQEWEGAHPPAQAGAWVMAEPLSP